MKQLQNNYTTPEQSKRLLELGVPADSADCCFVLDGTDEVLDILCVEFRLQELEKENYIDEDFYNLPCWSVGRLMEIYDTCDAEYMHKGWDCYFDLTIDYVAFVVKMFEWATAKGALDFSKLEG